MTNKDEYVNVSLLEFLMGNFEFDGLKKAI